MIEFTMTNGHQIVWLDNQHLRLSVVPGKGADITDIIHVPSGVDFLMKTPWGLKPPGDTPPADFLENYEGGWQELFPNPNDPAEYRGVRLPFHGEAALLPWECELCAGDSEVRLWTDCRLTPFRLEKRLRLLPGVPVMQVDAAVINRSDEPQPFLWGQHIVLGGSFLESGCRMETPAGWIVVPAPLYEPETARLEPGQREAWPFARLRSPGERMDLRDIPGPEARQHDDIFLTGLERGELTVANPRLQLAFRLEWDAGVFGCITNWRPLGGAILPPLTSIYGLGIEPWVSELSFNEALKCGKTLELAPGSTLRTTLTVTILTTSSAG